MPPEDDIDVRKMYDQIVEEADIESLLIQRNWKLRQQDAMDRQAEEKRVQGLLNKELERAEDIFRGIPYDMYSDADDKSLSGEIAAVGNEFIRAFYQWKRSFTLDQEMSGDLTNWDNRLAFTTSLCDAIENGALAIRDVDDMKVWTDSFPSFNFFTENLVTAVHFTTTGSLIDVAEYLRTFGKKNDARTDEILYKSLNKLCAHEMYLGAEDEKNGTDVLKDFLSMPMDIRAALADSFQYYPDNGESR